MTIDTNGDTYKAAYFISLHAFLGRSDLKPFSGNNSIELAIAYAHDAAVKVVKHFNEHDKR